MPLKLVPPRRGKSPNFRVRGTHFKQYVDRTSGTSDRAKARKVLKKIEREIEAGVFADSTTLTFGRATLAYLKAGGDDRFIGPLIEHFGECAISRIDQIAIDDAAELLYPLASAATRNRQVYTPLSAILKHVGINQRVKRPKGSAGKMSTRWLRKEEVFAIVHAAFRINPEFAVLLIFLCYTGMRISEALSLRCKHVDAAESFAYLPTSKNEEPRPIFLTPFIAHALMQHPAGIARSGERLFRFTKNKHLYRLLKGTFDIAKVELGSGEGFHVFCHTYASWMRRYAGVDLPGLVSTGRWKDTKSVERYLHVVVGEDARKAVHLPTPSLGDPGGRSVASADKRKKSRVKSET